MTLPHSLQALLVGLMVGLAERGQRRVEEPPLGLDQFRLDTYVYPDSCSLHRA